MMRITVIVGVAGCGDCTITIEGAAAGGAAGAVTTRTVGVICASNNFCRPFISPHIVRYLFSSASNAAFPLTEPPLALALPLTCSIVAPISNASSLHPRFPHFCLMLSPPPTVMCSLQCLCECPRLVSVTAHLGCVQGMPPRRLHNGF